MENNNTTSTSRHPIITLLLIVSFVGVILTSIYDLMLAALQSVPDDTLNQAIEQSKTQLEPLNIGDESKVDFNVMFRMIDNSLYHLMFNIIEFAGLILLYRRYDIGVHFYIASQIGIAYISYITFQEASGSMIMTCVLFSLLYFFYHNKIKE